MKPANEKLIPEKTQKTQNKVSTILANELIINSLRRIFGIDSFIRSPLFNTMVSARRICPKLCPTLSIVFWKLSASTCCISMREPYQITTYWHRNNLSVTKLDQKVPKTSKTIRSGWHFWIKSKSEWTKLPNKQTQNTDPLFISIRSKDLPICFNSWLSIFTSAYWFWMTALFLESE